MPSDSLHDQILAAGIKCAANLISPSISTEAYAPGKTISVATFLEIDDAAVPAESSQRSARSAIAACRQAAQRK